MHDRLRPLWDFSDLDASEARLRARLAQEETDEGRAEVLTQLARVEGLRGAYDAADGLLEEARGLAGGSGVATTRIALERGRVRRSSGDPAAAYPLFESAFASAVAGELWFLAGDAAHMAALAAPDREASRRWTGRGLELADEHETAAYWAGPLLNNLGWDSFDAGDFEGALDAFEAALDVRLRSADEEPVALARYAVGKALRSLGRPAEAIAHLEPAVAWADARGAPDGWYLEELAEAYAAVGRAAEAAEAARRALPLLFEADPGFANDASRSSRLQLLAG
jgi:tetratricopeptide (TPR) repeat protein